LGASQNFFALASPTVKWAPCISCGKESQSIAPASANCWTQNSLGTPMKHHRNNNQPLLDPTLGAVVRMPPASQDRTLFSPDLAAWLGQTRT
jgi:hypothetical protein